MQTLREMAETSGTAMDILLAEPTEVSARAVLWHASTYLYATQHYGRTGTIYNHSRVEAMDLLDDIRRDYANWH